MIPKRAFFTWVGDGDLPWLRQLSVDSFKKHNPDWDVDLIRIPPDLSLLAAQRTDIYRYSELAISGGVYLDTDIVFFRPLPDSLLDSEVAITLDKSAFRYSPAFAHMNPDIEHMPGFTSLALMGAVPNTEFFARVWQEALKRLSWLREDNVDLTKYMYQAFGTELLNRLFYGKTKEEIEESTSTNIRNVPLEVVLPIGWWESNRLFNSTPFTPSTETIGVHWYGGCSDSMRYCSQLTLDTIGQRPCYLSSAIEAALA